jgi:hypothetical protein
MKPFSLHDIAPRLARARDQRREELRVASAQRRHMQQLLLKAERCVAHRDLQLQRAFIIDKRFRMLRQAEAELSRLQQKQTAVQEQQFEAERRRAA